RGRGPSRPQAPPKGEWCDRRSGVWNHGPSVSGAVAVPRIHTSIREQARERHDAGPKPDLRIVRTRNEAAQAALLHVRRLSARDLPHHPGPFTSARESVDLSVRRWNKVGLAAARLVALVPGHGSRRTPAPPSS